MTLLASATLVVARPAPDSTSGFEVACVHRAKGLRFLGDFWAFPGGRAEEGERPRAAALRETFEETGLLLVPGAAELDGERLARARAELLASGAARFGELVAGLGLDLAAGEAALVQGGRWITPPFNPTRFETPFFVGAVDRSARLELVEGELDGVEWLDPVALLARWRNDEALLAPPTRLTLEALAGLPARTRALPPAQGWLEAAGAALAASAPASGEWAGGIDFRPGVKLFPLVTPTLPPATHTNCFVVGDGSELVVIDPASPYPEEQARLDAYLDALAAGGQRVREILLTHHHADHSSGAQHLSQRLGVPIAAHRRTQELLRGRVDVKHLVGDGHLFELPADRPGARPRRLRAHLLEGHADGHLAFHEEVTNGVIAGDMVAGVGTILIDPPEGKMALYLDSLRRLSGLGPGVIYPAHGPAIGDPARFVDDYVAHRLMREAKVLAAVQAGAGPIEELVPRAYDDTPAALHILAARSLLAHLEKLEQEGKVAREGETWRAA